jgi:polyisoprenoid-binding protein YceI
VENFSEITFRGNQVVVIGEVDYSVTGDLTIRGVTRPVSWRFTTSGNDKRPGGKMEWTKDPKPAPALSPRPQSNRHDFGVSWNDKMDQSGIVVSNIVEITIDAEAILETSD